MTKKFIRIPTQVEGVQWVGSNVEEVRAFVNDRSHFLPDFGTLRASYWDQSSLGWKDLSKGWWIIKENGKIRALSGDDLAREFTEIIIYGD